MSDSGASARSARRRSSEPALHSAVSTGDVTQVSYLLLTGANINEVGMTGTTALHLASKAGNPGIVQDLIGNGADINAADNEGSTALQLAVYHGHATTTQLLLDAGCVFTGMKFAFSSHEAKEAVRPLLLRAKEKASGKSPEEPRQQPGASPAQQSGTSREGPGQTSGPDVPDRSRELIGAVRSRAIPEEPSMGGAIPKEPGAGVTRLESQTAFEEWMGTAPPWPQYTQQFLQAGFSSLFSVVVLAKEQVKGICDNIGMTATQKQEFVRRWEELVDETSRLSVEGTELDDDVKTARAVYARLNKRRSAQVALYVNRHGGNKVTTLEDKLNTLHEAMLDPSVPQLYVRQRLRAWVVSAASVVHALHRAGVVWGGVRPDNFIVKSTGENFPILQATDFSRAALSATATAASGLTHNEDQLRLSRGLVGDLPLLQHLRYLAPEVAQATLDGKSHLLATEAQDIWSLGMMIYRVEVGYPYPFQGRSAGEVAVELSDLAEGKETIQLATTGQEGRSPFRRTLDVMLATKDPRERASMETLLKKSYFTSQDTVTKQPTEEQTKKFEEHAKHVAEELQRLRLQFSEGFDVLRSDFFEMNAASLQALKGDMGHVAESIGGLAAVVGSNRALEDDKVRGVQEDMRDLVDAVRSLSGEASSSAAPLREIVDQLGEYNHQLANMNTGRASSAAELRDMATAVEGMQSAMNKRFAAVERTLVQHDQKLDQLIWGVQKTAAIVDQLITGHTECPKLLLLVPKSPQRWRRGPVTIDRTWCRNKKANMVFLCAYNLHPACCGPSGNGFTIKSPSESLRKWAPALKSSLAVLRIAAAVTRVVTGLPIPIPEGPIDKDKAVSILFGLEEEYTMATGERGLAGELGREIDSLFDKLEDQGSRRGNMSSSRGTPMDLNMKANQIVQASGQSYQAILSYLDGAFPRSMSRRSWRGMLGLQPVTHPRTAEVTWVCDKHRSAYLARAAGTPAGLHVHA